MFWKRKHVYLQVTRNEVRAKELLSGEVARTKCDALSHPRMLMGDFFGVEKCFSEIATKLAKKGFLRPAPTIYVHLLEKIDGGVTNIEARAFREAAISAGAAEVHIPNSERPLTDEQLLNKRFTNWDGA
jgi:hypothetical protein